MSLDALWTATAGLKATQAAISVVSQNVANSGTAGYVRRTIDTVASAPGNTGVSTGVVTRSFDAAALKQLRAETAGAAYTSTRSGITTQLDKLYGTPGTATALDGTFNAFTQSLQELTASPTSAAARNTVLSNASTLASQINSAATNVQDLRTGIEAQLGTDTASASTLLKNIAALNLKVQNTTDASSRADLQDQRDQAINSLSSYMDITTTDQRDGTVSVLTGSGVTLVDRGNAATLSFDGRGSLNATSRYSPDASQRTVGTITATTPGGAKIDLGAPGTLRSGSLAAEFELRDTTLPQAQRQLDDLAAGLATSLTNKSVTGTVSGNTASIDLSGIKAGNAVTIPVTFNDGSVRNVTLVASTSPTATIDPSLTADATGFAQTFDIRQGAPYKDAVNAALSAMSAAAAKAGYKNVPLLTADGSGSTLTVSGNASTAVGGASASITVPTSANDFTSGYPEQTPLFTDGTTTLFTGSVDKGAQLSGFAQRIAVNGALTSNSSSLTSAGPTDTTVSGTRAQKIFDALTTAQQTFSSASGIGGVSAPYHATVSQFAQDVISAQGAAASAATTLDNTQQVALSTAQGRFSATAGVNIDEEMSNLIALQTAYGANARVLTAARDMLNQLLQI
ncbi:flagellar hook-associated protein FlgK [Methylobacterium sp. J-076]|uniref:flagellar hook-associated protein FlgK n=1 Tax=Methylobacterium sp. J-076 TaxID=2836655 RepID=UPI001FBBC03C|nr:flagellar hook-associated protein FlgK [Methylobacterium sp. J-076]MCJ2015361.1 flagellar hook-associated protein FlgK [Methylobacterium sp. J-076]